MTGKILDIEKWKTQYPFLNEVWTFYNELDKTLNETDNVAYSQRCNTLDIYEEVRINEQKNTCTRLFKNTFLLSNRDYSTDDFTKYCDILYIWLYFEIQKYNLNAQIINKIFQGSVSAAQQKSRKQISCPYFSYNEKLEEAEKLIKLRIFQYNISTIQNILNNIIEPNNCSCLEYVYECVNIYKDMHKRYCATDEGKNKTYKGTCDILKNFNLNYSSYIRNIKEEIYKLPFLSDTTTSSHTPTGSHATRCLLNKQKLELGSGAVHQSSSPKQISISTALSTMAGIPPFLALIYKVNIICT
ncbi:hypothetical protein PVBG_05188 [Plasmodium vivax Brazil I]|uniref:VIR protein n=1 Tax=Plasmodium vivax (strain Brazil I) TaxID=1033975 RepID=A0A0J9VAT3_PLAV1|nr:hypothetical protein PVBG_05188 [Plasmodium vivax Brazil I]